MRKIKGMLLRKKPFKIGMNGLHSLKVTISELADLKQGDKVYQEKLEDGTILLIPEKVYLRGEDE